MTLLEYRGFIDELIEMGHGKKVVVYAGDEEGNDFNDLFFKPTPLKVTAIKHVYRGKGKGTVICIN